MNIAQSWMIPAWIMSATLVAFGYGLGLLTAPGKAPQRLYVVGTILALVAAALLALEYYIFILGPVMAGKWG